MRIMPERSMYMIKPEAMESRDEIRELIGRHLAITAMKTLRLPRQAIRELYADLDGDLWTATDSALRNPVELGVVEGEDAIEVMLELAGSETDPSKCDPNSIRFKYGTHLPTMINDTPYYPNAIHRPKSSAEAVAHVSLVYRLNDDK